MATSFVTMLRSELARRCAKNEAYSLRAFARDLAIDHATLSQMLRGRRDLSPAMVERLGRELAMPEALLAAFVRDATAQSNEPNLAADAARILVEPIHEAILDLAERSELGPDTRLYARVLDSDVDTVNVAVQRLVRVGLLVMETETRWTSRLDREGMTAFDLAVWRHVSRRLAEPKENPSPMPTTPPPKKNPVSQFQIIAKDPAAAASFYTGAFGWTIDDANALGYREVSTGGLDGGIWPAPADAPSFVQLFVAVDDVEQAITRATTLGARVIVPPQALPDGDTMAVLLDPQGISFGVVRRRD